MAKGKKVWAVDLDWNIVGGKKTLEDVIKPENVRHIGTYQECETFVEAQKPAPTPAPVEETVTHTTTKNEESMVAIFAISSPQSLTNEPAPKHIEQLAYKAWGGKNKRR